MLMRTAACRQVGTKHTETTELWQESGQTGKMSCFWELSPGCDRKWVACLWVAVLSLLRAYGYSTFSIHCGLSPFEW